MYCDTRDDLTAVLEQRAKDRRFVDSVTKSCARRNTTNVKLQEEAPFNANVPLEERDGCGCLYYQADAYETMLGRTDAWGNVVVGYNADKFHVKKSVDDGTSSSSRTQEERAWITFFAAASDNAPYTLFDVELAHAQEMGKVLHNEGELTRKWIDKFGTHR